MILFVEQSLRAFLQNPSNRRHHAGRIGFQRHVLLLAALEVLDLADARVKLVLPGDQGHAETAAVGVLQLLAQLLGLRKDLDAVPTIGSICSGGRYDNLAGLFTARELPGIGASLGLDRLLAAMEELGMVEKTATPAPVFIPYFDKDRLHDYLSLAAALRAAGIGAEVFPEPKKLGQQLKYADRRGFRVALIAGGNEFESGTCQVKDLANASQQNVPLEPGAGSVIEAIRKILGIGD